MGDVSIEMLHRLLVCDPQAGRLFWRERTPDLFVGAVNADRACRAWNTRFAGKAAIASESASHGYRDGAILGRGALAHRVIFAMSFGRWPVGIDHANGDRRDNRIGNLSEATHAENARNQKVRSDNRSGIPGVWQAPSGRWGVRIKRNGTAYRLGHFATFEAAADARREAERLHGFHPNHGRAS